MVKPTSIVILERSHSQRDIPCNNVYSDVIPKKCIQYIMFCCFQMKVYTYNWAQNLQGSFENQMTKLVMWHNARSLLLTSILSQKAGLFSLPATYVSRYELLKSEVNCILSLPMVKSHLILTEVRIKVSLYYPGVKMCQG